MGEIGNYALHVRRPPLFEDLKRHENQPSLDAQKEEYPGEVVAPMAPSSKRLDSPDVMVSILVGNVVLSGASIQAHSLG